MNDIPKRLYPVYETPDLNSEIVLYKGTLEFSQNDQTFKVNSGEILLSWLPIPRVKFRVRGHTTSDLRHPLGAAKERKIMPIVLSNINVDGYYLVNRVRKSIHQNGMQTIDAEGIFHQTLRGQQGGNIAYLLLHLTNFVSYIGEMVQTSQGNSASRRLRLESLKWRVVIDAVDEWEKELHDNFNNLDGFAITHVCKIEKVDGSGISLSEIEAILNKLNWFFTFIKGGYCSAILPIGYDKDGNKIWESWSFKTLRLTHSPLSWFPSFNVKGIKDLFLHFLNLMDSESWRKILVPAIDWYVGSQNSFHTGANILSSQVGIELLGWSKLVEIDQSFSKTKFDELKAAGRMRAILNWAGLPLAVPTTLPNLLKDAQANKWQDGPHALVKIRDSVVHPHLRGRMVTVSNNALYEASKLGTWYLELLLLKLLNYQGLYHNRLDNDPNHLADYSEPVLWMKK